MYALRNIRTDIKYNVATPGNISMVLTNLSKKSFVVFTFDGTQELTNDGENQLVHVGVFHEVSAKDFYNTNVIPAVMNFDNLPPKNDKKRVQWFMLIYYNDYYSKLF
jgi:hypothetical protein